MTRTIACFSLLLAIPTIGFAQPREQRRPCGPGAGPNPIRLLIPQRFFGADFKPACRVHDHCYSIPGTNKWVCDREFFDQLNCACEQSRFPNWCKLLTKIMYRSVQGPVADRSFQRGQSEN